MQDIKKRSSPSKDKSPIVTPVYELPFVCSSQFELTEDFRLVSEANLDVLQEQFPHEYKDMYREDQNTWKLKTIHKQEHIDFLNKKYTNEQKFYMKLLCDLLRMKESYYSCMTSFRRELLDKAIMDAQIYLDYIVLLIPENDHKGEWNEEWTMNRSHTDYNYYHPPEHDNVEATITVNFAKEWLRHDAVLCHLDGWLYCLNYVIHLKVKISLHMLNHLLQELYLLGKPMFHTM